LIRQKSEDRGKGLSAGVQLVERLVRGVL